MYALRPGGVIIMRTRSRLHRVCEPVDVLAAFTATPLEVGIKVWTDRDYVFHQVPELVGAMWYGEKHRTWPKRTVFSILILEPSYL